MRCISSDPSVAAMQTLEPVLLDCCLPVFKVLDVDMPARLAHVNWNYPREWVVDALTRIEQDSAGGFIVSLLARAEEVLVACPSNLQALLVRMKARSSYAQTVFCCDWPVLTMNDRLGQ